MVEGLILLHDNATLHKMEGWTSLIDSYNWEMLDHPPFPRTCTCNYDFLPKLQENIRGIRYSDLEDLEAAVATRSGI